MPTYHKAPAEVSEMANDILCQFDSHRPVLDAKVKIDYVFALPTLDDNGEPTGHAISKGGIKALGMCRPIGLKDRAMGRGDVEITIDAEWWNDAKVESQRALLDHELNHIEVAFRKGMLITDDLHRPKVKMRKHDYEFGWFTIIAERHGNASIERQQARQMTQGPGQMIFDFDRLPITRAEDVTLTIATDGMEPINLTGEQLKKAAKKLANKAA